MKKKNKLFTEKCGNLKCERNIPFGTKFRYILYPQKGLKKPCPLVYLQIPIRVI